MTQQYEPVAWSFTINDFGTHGQIDGYLGKLNWLKDSNNSLGLAFNAQLQAGEDAAQIKADIIQIRDVDIAALTEYMEGLRNQTEEIRNATNAIAVEDITEVDVNFRSVQVLGVNVALEDDYVTFQGLINDNKDLNTYVTTGVYRQHANIYASNGTNYPCPYAGLLTVTNDSTMTFQTYHAYNENGYFHRSRYGDTWGEWLRVFDDTYHPLPTPSEIGADDTQYVYSNWNGDFSVDLALKKNCIIQLYGDYERTITLVGCLPAGGTLTVTVSYPTSKKTTLTGSTTMYIHNGSSDTTQDLHGQGTVIFHSHNGTELMEQF